MSKQQKQQQTAASSEAAHLIQALLVRNVGSLMAALPVHSHHRAPLLHELSRDIPSSAAAPLLHASPSYIRDCKRKDYSQSDLLTQKYQPGTKRQRLSDDTLHAVVDSIVAACPPHRRSRSLTFTQHIGDDALYQQYKAGRPPGIPAVSLHTFLRLKHWLRVRRAGKYFGQFDCWLCLRLRPQTIGSCTCRTSSSCSSSWRMDTDARSMSTTCATALTPTSMISSCLLYTSPSPRDGLLS